MADRVQCMVAGRNLTIETSRMARQADGACVVQYGETVVICTAVAGNEPKEGHNFLPLTVDYQQKAYSAGKIPGGYFKREGKPGHKEIVTARLIDRPLRPLFPEGFRNELHVVSLVLSFDLLNDPDLLSLIGASCALHISDIPFDGPVSAVRIGRIEEQFIVNPTMDQLEASEINLIVAGKPDAIVMVEGQAEQVPEEVILDAIELGQKELQAINEIQEDLKRICGKEKKIFPLFTLDDNIYKEVEQKYSDAIQERLELKPKKARERSYHELKKQLVDEIKDTAENDDVILQYKEAFEKIHKTHLRNYISQKGVRADGRNYDDVRPISIDIGILPRSHGSALFTRGETQALATTTLGTSEDEQRIDDIEGDVTKSFLLHYNFPPFSVGEAGFMRGPGRREIGHGNLAERALEPVLPEPEEFPYTIRIVSDILESNGSSSMATVCGSALSLMDAGVPIKAPVSGVAMGLIKNDDQIIILTDIEGSEDHSGDLDFKVAGSQNGVTAIQMDIKIDGITMDILREALKKAYKGRAFILDKMLEVIGSARPELSRYAPRVESVKINPEKIRDLIGPGGKMIREIVDKTGAKIDVEQDGTVRVYTYSADSLDMALEMIEAVTGEPEVGKTYMGTVRRIENYGAFIEIMPGTDGLLHVSHMPGNVRNPRDIMKEGDEVEVRLLLIDDQGRCKLTQLSEDESSRIERSSSRGGRGDRRPSSDRGNRSDRDRFSDRGDRGDRGDSRRDYRDRGSRRDDRGGRGGGGGRRGGGRY